MGYVIAALIVLLIVGAGVTFLVLNATRRKGQAAASDSGQGRGAPGSEAAILAPDDETPLGDTDQHSGHTTPEGETIPEDHPRRQHAGGSPPGGRGGVGGEGEGTGPHEGGPESERLANRPR